MEYTITRRADTVLDNLAAKLTAAYCDRDFRCALRELKESDEGNRYQNLDNLLRMLRSVGFNGQIKGNEKDAFYEKVVTELIEQGVILSDDEMSSVFMGVCKELFMEYRDYPSPAAYMQRLVDRCCIPTDPWQNDTLRLRILKQFIKYGNYLTAAEIGKKKPIQTYVKIKLGQESVADKEVLMHLDDHIFAMLMVPSSKEIELGMQKAAAQIQPEVQAELHAMILDAANARPPAAFDEKTYQVAADLLLHDGSIQLLTKSILLRYAAETSGGECGKEAEAVSLLSPAICKAVSSSVTAVVSRTLKQAETRSSVIKTMASKLKEKEITAEKLMNYLYSALHKAIRKMNNEDYLLLRISDDLASGQFRTNGATKRNLYLFAVVYGMTYCYGTSPSTVNTMERDVEKNLFTDYYAANALQYLSDAHLNGRTEGEIIPSGCSINYKNYAEMIYLYCLCQSYDTIENSELPDDEKHRLIANEKLKQAAKMIEAVKVRGKNVPQPSTPDLEAGATLRMKARISGGSEEIACEDILSLPEEEFLNFITQNYDRRVHIDSSDISPFQVNAEDHTALEKYIGIVKKLFGSPDIPQENTPLKDYERSIQILKHYAKDDYDRVSQRDMRKEFSYGLVFDEAHWEADEKMDTIDQEFHQLLVSVDKLLRNWLDKPEEIHRTKLLAALYYDFNERYFNCDELQDHSFQTHDYLFRKEINPILEDCNYALLSNKSLLDVLIIFSSYLYLNT